jgi:HD superfamily phosphohydrolase
MPGKFHEIRDPIHVFIRMDGDERRILDSPAYQRLRNIHQLAMTYLVYPGATHRRFEHCLGVMELASRIFDVVTLPEHLDPVATRQLPNPTYWRRCLRVAALCHDVGHLPFSHAAEKRLLPEGWSHERIGLEIIRNSDLTGLIKNLDLVPDDVAKLALGPKEYPGPLNTWERILSEMIVGNVFGADRMDYLLRDSYHAGVAYGRFDHFRLIDTLRILPEEDGSADLALGVEQGGLQSAEALIWARYFMYTQLYFHHVRRIYDIHLEEFLKEWLPGGLFPIDPEGHLSRTDNEVLAAIKQAAKQAGAPGNAPAICIEQRKHFRLLYEQDAKDLDKDQDSLTTVYRAAAQRFGEPAVRMSSVQPKDEGANFPVLTRNDTIASSVSTSTTLQRMPGPDCGYVFIDPKHRVEARLWLEQNRETMFSQDKKG